MAPFLPLQRLTRTIQGDLNHYIFNPATQTAELQLHIEREEVSQPSSILCQFAKVHKSLRKSFNY